jgi:HlyD family secretion protein
METQEFPLAFVLSATRRLARTVRMKKLLLFLIVVGLGIAGAASWFNANNRASENGFEFDTVKYGTMTDLVNTTGILKPEKIALVFSKTPGIVEEIYGKVGQRVEKDEPLFKVNPEMARRALERANAAVRKTEGIRDAAKDAVDYIKKLINAGHAPPTEKELEAKRNYSAAVAGLEEAQSAQRQAQLALDWTMVKAPISGTIIEKNLFMGQPVGLSAAAIGGGSGGSGTGSGQTGLGGGPSMPSSTSSMFGITELRVPFIIAGDLEKLEAYSQISQSDIGRVKPGLEAKFTVDAFPEEPEFKGKVSEINLMPVNVQGATIFPAVIKVQNRREGEADKAGPKHENAEWVLRPGMSVNIDITCDTHPSVWKLPNAVLPLQMDSHYITPKVQAELDRRQKLPKPDDWVTVWIMDNNKKPWPIFARVGGKGEHGKAGIKEAGFTEVLEWDPQSEIAKGFKPGDERTYPQVIISAPQPKKSIFDQGTFKIS